MTQGENIIKTPKKDQGHFFKSKGYHSVRFKFTHTRHLQIKASINGVEGLFLIDTGASNSCVDFTMAEYFKLNPKAVDTMGVGAGNDNLLMQLAKKNTIQIGDWQHKKCAVVLLDLSHVNRAVNKKGKKQKTYGIIGADLLRKTQAVIDYSKKRLYLK